MKESGLVTIVLSLAALLLCQTNLFAQPPQSKCSQFTYSPSDVRSQTYRLDRIKGQAVYASPSQKWELGSANGICVNLLDRKNGVLVASVTTDGRGQFEFSNLAPGEYVLMVFAGDLQKLTIPIQLTAAAKGIKQQRLLIHLREQGDNRKSYITRVTNLALRKELLERVEKDQQIRDELVKSGVDHPDKAIIKRIDELGLRNAERMKSITREYGWPDSKLVGWDGTEAAFILIQHADHSSQKVLLPLLQKEFRAGRLSGPNYALFIDHVLVDEGRPQVYGSRARPFDQWQSREPVLYPIKDEANVDKRRAEVGLSSLAEYKQFLKKMYYP